MPFEIRLKVWMKNNGDQPDNLDSLRSGLPQTHGEKHSSLLCVLGLHFSKEML